jgi:hypothetical protein
MIAGARTFVRNRLPIALAALGIGFAAGWVVHPDNGEGHAAHSHDSDEAHEHGEGDFHAWVHAHLRTTPDQNEALAPHESAYETLRVELRDKIHAAGRELAEAIRLESDAASPTLASALSRLNQSQGELQRATLEHFFTMKQHLSPEQAELMRLWTHDRLIHSN